MFFYRKYIFLSCFYGFIHIFSYIYIYVYENILVLCVIIKRNHYYINVVRPFHKRRLS